MSNPVLVEWEGCKAIAVDEPGVICGSDMMAKLLDISHESFTNRRYGKGAIEMGGNHLFVIRLEDFTVATVKEEEMVSPAELVEREYKDSKKRNGWWK